MELRKIIIQSSYNKNKHSFNLSESSLVGEAVELFYFLLPISKEIIVLESNFRNGDFDGFTRFEVP